MITKVIEIDPDGEHAVKWEVIKLSAHPLPTAIAILADYERAVQLSAEIDQDVTSS
jgi:hypothetical protein